MPPPGPIKQKIARNFAISFAGRLCAGAIGIVSLAFITRTLGAEKFGDYSIVFAYLYVFSVFADFGLSSLLAREISKPGADEQKTVSEIFFAKLVLLLFFLLLSFATLELTPYSADAKKGVFLAALGFLMSSLTGVQMGIFQKYLKTAVPALADIAARSAQFVLVLILYRWGGGVLSFLAVFSLASTAQFLIVHYFAKKHIPFRIKFGLSSIKAVLKESWALAISAVLVLIYFKGDAIILSFLRSPYEVGIYGAAYKILENIIFFPIMFVGLVIPLLSNYFVSDRAMFQKVFQRTFDFLLVIALPLVAGGIYTADGIVSLIGGAGFAAAKLPTQVLFLAVFFIFLSALFSSTVIAVHKQKAGMWVYGAAAIANITANLYFISRYSYMGAAWVTAGTEFIVTVLMLAIIYRATRYLLDLAVFAKAAASSLVMLGVLYLSPFQGLLWLIVFGALVYSVSIYLLKGVSREDILSFVVREA